MDVSPLYSLQFGWWGFRVNGGALQSYPTRAEAEAARVAAEWRAYVEAGKGATDCSFT